MKPVIFMVLVLAACGRSSGGGKPQPSPPTTTQTPTSTATGTVAVTKEPVSQIVSTVASVVLCKTLAQQPAAVQTLLASALAAPPQTNIAGLNTTDFHNTEWHPGDVSPAGTYSDGTDVIQWGVTAFTDTGLIYAASYQEDGKPTVINRVGTCP